MLTLGSSTPGVAPNGVLTGRGEGETETEAPVACGTLALGTMPPKRWKKGARS